MELRCPFCHAPLLEEEARVTCGACHTLHHEECWLENFGKCAIFGCGGGAASPSLGGEGEDRHIVVLPRRPRRRIRREEGWRRRRRTFGNRIGFIFPLILLFASLIRFGLRSAEEVHLRYALPVDPATRERALERSLQRFPHDDFAVEILHGVATPKLWGVRPRVQRHDDGFAEGVPVLRLTEQVPIIWDIPHGMSDSRGSSKTSELQRGDIRNSSGGVPLPTQKSSFQREVP